MARVIAEIDVAAPPEKIWAVIEDPRRYAELSPPTERMIEVPEGPLGVGSVYRQYGGIKPFVSESTWEVVEWNPPRHTVHIGDDGTAKIHLTIDIRETDLGSHLRQEVEVRPRWWLAGPNAVMWPLMMRRRVQDAMDRTVLNLKRVVEVD